MTPIVVRCVTCALIAILSARPATSSQPDVLNPDRAHVKIFSESAAPDIRLYDLE